MTHIERGLSIGCGIGVFLVAYQAFLLAWKVGSVEVGLIGFVLFGCAWGITSYGTRR